MENPWPFIRPKLCAESRNMAKRKFEEGEEPVRKLIRVGPNPRKIATPRKPRKPSYKTKAKATLLSRKKELRSQYKKVQNDLKQVDRDLKSLGYTIRKGKKY